MSESTITYQWRRLESLSEDDLSKCAELFSEHYGTWSLAARSRPGKRISLSSERLRDLLTPSGASASLAFCDDELVGHAFSVRRFAEGAGYVSWVTQLVVHRDFRRRKIATRLLNAIWAFSDDFAWGLVTANPFTVRTLERATRRRCDPRSVGRHAELLRGVAAVIPYAKDSLITVTRSRSIIDTDFQIDHTEVQTRIRQVEPPKWRLGNLNLGDEWLAFTFQRQRTFPLQRAELEAMFVQSEQILREAYGRMILDASHKWAQHADAEVESITGELRATPGMAIVDFGCGKGRHCIALAQKGFRVVGVDFLPNFLRSAEATRAGSSVEQVTFMEGDCRTVQVGQEFDIGLCLYDVIGSYADQKENVKLLKNLVEHVRIGGYVVFSVMNMTLTRRRAKFFGDVFEKPSALQALKPSNIMQQTGDVFDPEHYLIDTASGTVFRKEQFAEDGLLSAELIVRDRRYEADEVAAMCEEVGIEPLAIRHVRAGRWNEALDATDDRAKEILVIGRRRN